MSNDVDLAIVGAGAAGLAAAIFAGEAARALAPALRIVCIDGAKRPGAKILVSGGSRCNVTNERVTEADFFGGPRTVIRRVLKRFDHTHTLVWMQRLGVELKLEPTGKYFPVTDSSRTVLDALLRRLDEVGVRLRAGTRVDGLEPPAAGAADSWAVQLAGGERLRARRLIVATGGLALPKSGSDGWGLAQMRRLGHTIVPTTPALVPLICDPARPGVGGRFAEFAGVTLDVRLALHAAATGKRLEERAGSLVFTHFGISGPAALDLSRHWLRARLERPDEALDVRLGVPGWRDLEAAQAWLRKEGAAHPKRDVATALRAWLPERLARAYAEGLPTFANLSRSARKALAQALVGTSLQVTGDRGYSHAEVTAGGVDLHEVDVATMASRRLPALHLVGEILDVDGRLGGYNFTWAWASGHIAGRAAVDALRGT